MIADFTSTWVALRLRVWSAGANLVMIRVIKHERYINQIHGNFILLEIKIWIHLVLKQITCFICKDVADLP